MDPKPLKTYFKLSDEIVLRTFSADDAEVVYSSVIQDRNHLKTYMHWMTDDYSLGSAREFLARSIQTAADRENLGLGIFRGEELIGSIGFVSFDWKSRKTEIGYWIASREEGKGIVSKACTLLIEYAFGELGMNRIEIRCSTENVRSAAIPERLGFTREGVLRESEIRNGRLQDFAVYGLLAREWKNQSL